jgi:hypothetical protein
VVERQLAVACQRDLRARIAALFDVLADQPVEVFERLKRRAERRERSEAISRRLGSS